MKQLKSDFLFIYLLIINPSKQHIECHRNVGENITTASIPLTENILLKLFRFQVSQMLNKTVELSHLWQLKKQDVIREERRNGVEGDE